jgi:hypothetical protein
MPIPGMTSIQPFLRRGYRMKLGNTSCSTIKESMAVNLHWIIRLFEAIKMYRVLQAIQMAGLEDFWEKVQKRAQLGIMLYRMQTAETRDDVFSIKPKALNLETSPQIVFYLYFILIGIAITSFFRELLQTINYGQTIFVFHKLFCVKSSLGSIKVSPGEKNGFDLNELKE